MAEAAQRNDASDDRDPLTAKVIGAAIEAHRMIGPGLLESAYSECLAHELAAAQLFFEREKPVPLRYKSVVRNCAYRLDFLIEGKLIIEVKCVEQFNLAHEAHLLTHMRLANAETGLLLNFQSFRLKDRILPRKLFPSKTSAPSVLLASSSV